MGVVTPVLFCDLYRMRSQTTGAVFPLSDAWWLGGHGGPDRQTDEVCAPGMPASSGREPAGLRKPSSGTMAVANCGLHHYDGGG